MLVEQEILENKFSTIQANDKEERDLEAAIDELKASIESARLTMRQQQRQLQKRFSKKLVPVLSTISTHRSTLNAAVLRELHLFQRLAFRVQDHIGISTFQ